MDALKRIIMLKTLKETFNLTKDEMDDIVEIGDHTFVVVQNNSYNFVSIEDIENIIDGSLDYEDLKERYKHDSIRINITIDSRTYDEICTDTLST